MFIFRIFTLNIICLLFFGIFSLQPTVEVYFYENRGAWIESNERVVDIYEKKCVLLKQKKIDKILHELAVIESKNLRVDYLESCNYVMRLKFKGSIKIIGFDNRVNDNDIIYINSIAYKTSGKLFSFIKRNCICKWK